MTPEAHLPLFCASLCTSVAILLLLTLSVILPLRLAAWRATGGRPAEVASGPAGGYGPVQRRDDSRIRPGNLGSQPHWRPIAPVCSALTREPGHRESNRQSR